MTILASCAFSSCMSNSILCEIPVLFSTLNAYGLPDNSTSHAFVNEVCSRVPKKSRRTSKENAPKGEQETSLSSQKYLLIEDEDIVDRLAPLVKHTGKKQSRKDKLVKAVRRTRKRDKDDYQWEGDEDDVNRKGGEAAEDPESQSREEDDQMTSPLETGEERLESARIKDLSERDTFANRVRDCDTGKTKKVVEDKSSKGFSAEAAKRRELADNAAARVVAMPSLRERSRQDYLSKRELQQIELLRKEIADDENLFRGMKISKTEKKNLEYKREVLRLAEDRMKIDDKYDGYQLPEDYITEQGKIDKKKQQAVLLQRYDDAKAKEDQFVTDVDQWEESQAKHSAFKSGVLDKEEIADDYEYVFDESQTIQFVFGNTLHNNQDGPLSAADRLLKSQIEEAEKLGTSDLRQMFRIAVDIFRSVLDRRDSKVFTHLSIPRSVVGSDQGTSSSDCGG